MKVNFYVGAITTLYNEGLYNDADDAFVTAVREAFFRCLSKTTFGAEKRIARFAWYERAARIVPSELHTTKRSSVSWNRTELWDNDMVIITGQGRNHSNAACAASRVQRMLVEEFILTEYCSVPGNTGALRRSHQRTLMLTSHQREQRVFEC
jgi:hypothetical protein